MTNVQYISRALFPPRTRFFKLVRFPSEEERRKYALSSDWVDTPRNRKFWEHLRKKRLSRARVFPDRPYDYLMYETGRSRTSFRYWVPAFCLEPWPISHGKRRTG